MHASYLVLSCTIISAGGWVWETCYCSVVERRLARRGMLFGPSCPIYGTCAIVVWFALGGVRNTAALFALGFVLSTALEYGAGALLERRFGRRWWDYSMFSLNFRGLVCPQASCVFGVFAVINVKLLQPTILGGLATLDYGAVLAAAGLVCAAYTLDLFATVLVLDGWRPRRPRAARAPRPSRLSRALRLPLA